MIFLFFLNSNSKIRFRWENTWESHVWFRNSYFLTFVKFWSRFRWEDTWESPVCFRNLYFFTFFSKLDSDEKTPEKLTWVLGTCIFLLYFFNLFRWEYTWETRVSFTNLYFFIFLNSNSRTRFRWEDTWESHVCFRNSYYLTFVKFWSRFRWDDTWESHVCFRNLYFFTYFSKLDSDENIRENLTCVLGTRIIWLL